MHFAVKPPHVHTFGSPFNNFSVNIVDEDNAPQAGLNVRAQTVLISDAPHTVHCFVSHLAP